MNAAATVAAPEHLTAERLDVLAFERGDEGGGERLADLLGDFFVRAAGGGELLQAAGLAGGLAEFDHCLDAVPRLLGAGFEQGKKAVFLTKESGE